MNSEQIAKIAEVLERIVSKAENVAEYRKLVTEAARSGELDPSSDTFASANQRAKDFIEGGS